MSTYQKILNVLVVLLAIAAVGSIFVGLVLTAVGVLALTPEALAAAENVAEYENEMAQLFGLGLHVLGTGILLIPTSILGRRAVNKPNKTAAFMVFNVILLASGILGVVVGSSLGNIDALSIILLWTPIFMQGLALTCAIGIKRGYAKGEISLNWREEYMAERAAAGKKEQLGFIRFIQVVFGLCILGSLFMCIMLVSGSYQVHASFVVQFVNCVGQGVAFWLIAKRFKVTRYWVIGVSAFNIFVGTAGVLFAGDFTLGERLVSCSFDIFLILYFSLSKKVKRVLDVEFDLAHQKREALEAWDLWKPKTWDFWRAMIIYYCLFSIVGHWMEACYCLSIKYGIMPGIYDPTSGIWRDYLNPFPVYGVGMVACAALLYPVKTKLQDKLGGFIKPMLCSFVFNSLVCGVIELALGLLCNQNLELWDYSNMFCNFMGQICLLNTCLFGAVASLMAWVVYPALQKLYVSMPLDIKKTLFVGILVFYAVVICLYVVNLPVPAEMAEVASELASATA